MSENIDNSSPPRLRVESLVAARKKRQRMEKRMVQELAGDACPDCARLEAAIIEALRLLRTGKEGFEQDMIGCAFKAEAVLTEVEPDAPT